MDTGFVELRLEGGSSGGASVEFYSGSIGLADAYADTSKNFYIRTGGTTQALKLDASQNAEFAGNILPDGDNDADLGSASKRWANLFVGDLELSNEGSGGNDVDGTEGKWTIQEGEENLYLLNRKNNKKYKFLLEEIE